MSDLPMEKIFFASRGIVVPQWFAKVLVKFPILQSPIWLVWCPGGSGWAWRCVRDGHCGCSNQDYYRVKE
jgi:hypothetical protein